MCWKCEDEISKAKDAAEKHQKAAAGEAEKAENQIQEQKLIERQRAEEVEKVKAAAVRLLIISMINFVKLFW